MRAFSFDGEMKMQAQIPKLMRLSEVAETLGRSRSSLYRDVAEGRIPKPVKIGGSVMWLSSEIRTLMDQLIEIRDAAA